MKVLIIKSLADIEKQQELSAEWDLIIIHEDLNVEPELLSYLETRLHRNGESRIIRPSRISLIPN